MNKSVFKVTFESCAGFSFCIIILIGLNILNGFIDNYNYGQIVSFFNDYFYIVVITTFISYIANLIGALKFPFNMPSPIIHAINSIPSVFVLLKFLELLDELYDIAIFAKVTSSAILTGLIYTLIFFLVLLGGYVNIFVHLFKKDKKDKKKKKNKKQNDYCGDKGKKFKQALENAAEAFKKTMEGEGQKK